MTGEDIVDCILELDVLLENAESLLERQRYADALKKLKEARQAIDELRQDECVVESGDVEMDIMSELK